MDADAALIVVRVGITGDEDEWTLTPDEERALAALRGVVNTARAYVKGRSVGRFVALCQALQEPSDRPRKAEVSEEEVERYLRENGQLRITVDAARRLGLLAP